MDTIRTAINEVLAADNPMTVRQVFYQLVGRRAIDKTEAEYHQTVIRLLTSMDLRTTLNELQYVLSRKRTQAARVMVARPTGDTGSSIAITFAF